MALRQLLKLRRSLQLAFISASNGIPRSRERERMSALSRRNQMKAEGQVRVVGGKQFNAERDRVRYRIYFSRRLTLPDFQRKIAPWKIGG